MLYCLAGFAAFPFHQDGAIDSKGYCGQEEAAEVSSHAYFSHSAEPQGITVGGQDQLGGLGQAPEKGSGFDLLEFGAALGMCGDAVGIAAAAKDDDEQ